MNREEPLEIEDSRLELENRIRNLLWTVSGDYKLDMKPDISLFLRSRAIALYDGIKQGALARFYDKDLLGLYLVKKVFLQAGEGELTAVAQLCIEEAIGEKICEERPGIRSMQREAFEDILDQEFEEMPSQKDLLGRLKVAVLRRRLDGGEYRVERRMVPFMELVIRAGKAKDTMELIRVIDELYNALVDPMFERLHGNLERVLAVTLEELTEYSWEDFLSEEMYEEALESYVEQLTTNMAGMEDRSVTEEMEEKRHKKKNITVVTPEMLEKAYTYVELNYGKTYLSEAEEKRINYLMCRGVHSDCSLYFTEGILKNPAKRNYQYEYAKRLRNKNIWLYHDKHRIVKRNISVLTDTLRKSLVLRSETQTVLSDRGQIVPSRLWRIGRSRDAKFFEQELKGEASEFVVDVLIDASGSQMSRQGEVALQAYIISEALSNVEIPHRVMSFCTFWDYTILHRFREYDDPRTANENIFNYVTSSNNRDGLAIKTAGYGLLAREEEKKILIVLSDGKPYDVLVNRPNARNPKPYQGKEAISDTATEIRHLRNLELKGEASEFVVDVLIDASGSQMSRQGEVALQAYIISEALSNVEIPHRVMSFCTFWDYTILHRFREYDDPRTANENIFNYVTSSNNRDGLAIKTAGYGLLAREEEKKILIVLSDGKPYDVLVNRPNARNPKPYQGKEAISDTATEIRHLRNLEVSVLGVFAGEEKDLATEKKIFGKDFAYIRDIKNFSKIVGRYLTKQLEIDG